jgi:hypothetical protein
VLAWHGILHCICTHVPVVIFRCPMRSGWKSPMARDRARPRYETLRDAPTHPLITSGTLGSCQEPAISRTPLQCLHLIQQLASLLSARPHRSHPDGRASSAPWPARATPCQARSPLPSRFLEKGNTWWLGSGQDGSVADFPAWYILQAPRLAADDDALRLRGGRFWPLGAGCSLGARALCAVMGAVGYPSAHCRCL